MKFWQKNEIEGEFEMEPAAVAAAFSEAVLADTQDLRLKWLSWPRTRTVLDWMTAEWGLDASWDDKAGFDEILDLIDALAHVGSLSEI